MPYFDAFLIGFDLNSTFSYAGECIGHSVGLIDKWTQFENNFTYTVNFTQIEELRLTYPILNFTAMIAFQLAVIPLDCFEFAVQVDFYWTDLFAKMGNNISIFL